MRVSASDQKQLDQANARFVSCVGARNTDLDRVATLTTGFGGPAQSSVFSDATVYPTRRDLVNDTSIWPNPRTPGCYKRLVRQGSTPEDHTIVEVTMTGRRPGQPAQVVANRVETLSSTYLGKRTTRYITSVYLQGPLIEIEIDLDSLGTPFPARLRTQVVAAVANRAART